MVRLLKQYWFLLALGFVLALARWAPALGVFLDGIHVPKLTIIIFALISGMSVSIANLNHDLRDWRHHAFIQSLTFVVTPSLVYVTAFWLPASPLKDGVYLVATLPPTLATCIAYTSAAGGRVACAVINSVGGNVLGVFLSPLLLALMVGSGKAGFASAGRSIFDLVLLALIPLICGLLFRVHFPAFFRKIAPSQRYVSQLCVLVMTYCALSKSISALLAELSNIWQVLVYLVLVHIALTAGILTFLRRKGRSHSDSAAAVFCSTQKTMAIGLPLAYSFCAQSGRPLGLVVLPLVFYYVFQLIFGGIVIAYWTRQARAGSNGCTCAPTVGGRAENN